MSGLSREGSTASRNSGMSGSSMGASSFRSTASSGDNQKTIFNSSHGNWQLAGVFEDLETNHEHSIWNMLRRKTQAVENLFFGILFLMLKSTSSKLRWAIVQLLLEYFQLAGFSMYILLNRVGATSAFTFRSVNAGLNDLLQLVQIRIFVASLSLSAFTWLFFITCAAVFVAFCLAWFVGYGFITNKYNFLLPIKILRFAVTIFVTFGFIPVVQLIFFVFECNYFDSTLPTNTHMVFSGELTCWSNSHILLVAFGLATFIAFFSLSYAFSLVYFESTPTSRAIMKRGHSRVETVMLVSKCILTIGFAIFRHGSLTPVLVALVLLSSALGLGLYLFYLPLYRLKMNRIRVAFMSANFWAAICALIFTSISDAARVSGVIALVAGSPFAFAFGLWACSKWYNRICKTDPKKMLSPFHVEVATRFLQTENTESARQRASHIFEAGHLRFPDSSMLAVMHALFLRSYGQEASAALTQFKKAEAMDHSFDLRFLLFKFERERERENDSKNFGEKGMGLISYIEFQKQMKEISKFHKMALKAIGRFWKLLLQESIEVSELDRVAQYIEHAEARAKYHFKSVLQKHPNSVHILTQYAKFLQDVCNDPLRAKEMFGRADELREMQEREEVDAMAIEEAQEFEADDIGAFKAVDADNSVNEDSRVCVISERGIIVFVNDQMATMFGARASSFSGKNISTMMPDPYSRYHDRLLANYHRTKKAVVIGSSRAVFALHSNGYVFPCELAVSKLEEGGASLFSGILKPISNRSPVILVDEQMIVTGINLAFLTSLGFTAPRIVGKKVSELFPDVTVSSEFFHNLAGASGQDKEVNIRHVDGSVKEVVIDCKIMKEIMFTCYFLRIVRVQDASAGSGMQSETESVSRSGGGDRRSYSVQEENDHNDEEENDEEHEEIEAHERRTFNELAQGGCPFLRGEMDASNLTPDQIPHNHPALSQQHLQILQNEQARASGGHAHLQLQANDDRLSDAGSYTPSHPKSNNSRRNSASSEEVKSEGQCSDDVAAEESNLASSKLSHARGSGYALSRRRQSSPPPSSSRSSKEKKDQQQEAPALSRSESFPAPELPPAAEKDKDASSGTGTGTGMTRGTGRESSDTQELDWHRMQQRLMSKARSNTKPIVQLRRAIYSLLLFTLGVLVACILMHQIMVMQFRDSLSNIESSARRSIYQQRLALISQSADLTSRNLTAVLDPFDSLVAPAYPLTTFLSLNRDLYMSTSPRTDFRSKYDSSSVLLTEYVSNLTSISSPSTYPQTEQVSSSIFDSSLRYARKVQRLLFNLGVSNLGTTINSNVQLTNEVVKDIIYSDTLFVLNNAVANLQEALSTVTLFYSSNWQSVTNGYIVGFAVALGSVFVVHMAVEAGIVHPAVLSVHSEKSKTLSIFFSIPRGVLLSLCERNTDDRAEDSWDDSGEDADPTADRDSGSGLDSGGGYEHPDKNNNTSEKKSSSLDFSDNDLAEFNVPVDGQDSSSRDLHQAAADQEQYFLQQQNQRQMEQQSPFFSPGVIPAVQVVPPTPQGSSANLMLQLEDIEVSSNHGAVLGRNSSFRSATGGSSSPSSIHKKHQQLIQQRLRERLETYLDPNFDYSIGEVYMTEVPIDEVIDDLVENQQTATAYFYFGDDGSLNLLTQDEVEAVAAEQGHDIVAAEEAPHSVVSADPSMVASINHSELASGPHNNAVDSFVLSPAPPASSRHNALLKPSPVNLPIKGRRNSDARRLVNTSAVLQSVIFKNVSAIFLVLGFLLIWLLVFTRPHLASMCNIEQQVYWSSRRAVIAQNIRFLARDLVSTRNVTARPDIRIALTNQMTIFGDIHRALLFGSAEKNLIASKDSTQNSILFEAGCLMKPSLAVISQQVGTYVRDCNVAIDPLSTMQGLDPLVHTYSDNALQLIQDTDANLLASNSHFRYLEDLESLHMAHGMFRSFQAYYQSGVTIADKAVQIYIILFFAATALLFIQFFFFYKGMVKHLRDESSRLLKLLLMMPYSVFDRVPALRAKLLEQTER